MKNISEYINQELIWTRKHFFKGDYELCSGTDVIALLFPKMFRYFARAKTQGAQWDFDLKGIFRQELSIINAVTGVEICRCKLGWWGKALLRFPTGQEFQWTWRGVFFATYVWRYNNKEIISFKDKWTRIIVAIHPAAEGNAYVPLLTCLGAFLVIIDQRRRTTASSSS